MKKYLMMAMGMAMITSGGQNNSGVYSEELTDEEKEEKRIKLLKSKGMKQFWIEDTEIWARDEKNAIRKFNNLRHEI